MAGEERVGTLRTAARLHPAVLRSLRRPITLSRCCRPLAAGDGGRRRRISHSSLFHRSR